MMPLAACRRKTGFPFKLARGLNHNIYSQSSWTTGAPNPGTNYVAAATSVFDYYATKGVSFVRMMFTWEWVQPTLLDPIPPTLAFTTQPYIDYWNNFVASVNYLTNTLGMEVLIEHFGNCADYWAIGSPNTVPAYKSVGAGNQSYSNQIGGPNVTNTHFADLWSKMATFFKSNPKVVFGMVNEPHNMSTMQWFATAQAVISAIRATGATNKIFVPGNGYATWDWNNTNVDSAVPARSNAYGWDNANGVGQPLFDPLGKIYPSIHIYVDDAGGSTVDSPYGSSIIGYSGGLPVNAAVDRLKQTADWCRTRGLRCHVSEIGFRAPYTNGNACWAAFIKYVNKNRECVEGWSWWGSSDIGWWTDVGETHFSIAPTTAGSPATGDTENMVMIKDSFKEKPTTTVPPSPVGYTAGVTFTISTPGLDTYWMNVPSGYDNTHNTPYKLFVWLHGCGGQSQFDIDNVSVSSATPNWISMAPGGAESACWQATDAPRILAAIADVRKHFNIDPRQIFIGGYSSGGDIGYKLAFENSILFAGALFENTDPFLIGWGADGTYQNAPNKFNVAQLFHTSDGTYPRATILASMSSLTTAGYSVTTIEKAGTHYDNDVPGVSGTNYDMQTFLLPYLKNGWMAPVEPP